MGSATAAFFEPFARRPRSSGLLLHPLEELERIIVEADAAGFQLAVHAIGDRANSLVLDAFDEGGGRNGPRDRRFRIEHAQTCAAADLARFKALGVIASVQPSHCIDDMRFVEKHVGQERAAGCLPLEVVPDAGGPLAFGTDWFVEPLDPRLGLYAAVTREFPEGGPAGGFQPEEKISLEEALDALHPRLGLRGVRGGAARAPSTPGKLADLVVFASDLFRIPPARS